VARYWSINTVATAVLFSSHPSPLVITTKLARPYWAVGCSEEVFCRLSTAPVDVTAAEAGRGAAVTSQPDARSTHYPDAGKLAACVNYAKINNSLLRMRDHVSAGIFFAATSYS